MGRAIFISYRRDDTEGEAGRLFDDLVRAFGDDSVFMDVAGINPGIDFRKAIDDNVATCGVLLAIVGPQWTSITGSSGARRLDDENDFVRLEIASALARNVAVIPVLVHDAKVPHPDELPANLKDLAYRNSVEITHARWNSDVQLLTKALAQYVASPSAADSEPVHATVPVQLPAPNPGAAESPPPARSKTPLFAGFVAGALVLIALIAFFVHKSAGTPAPPTSSAAPSAGSAAALVGTWTNTSPGGTNELSRLTIFGAANPLTVHAWGSCSTCDWGLQTAYFDRGKASAKWIFTQPMGGEAKGRVATVTMTPLSGDLSVDVTNSFADRPPNQRRRTFVRSQ